MNRSLPVWGAWIETCPSLALCLTWVSLPVWGAWIETRAIGDKGNKPASRSPCGERGLKLEARSCLSHDKVAPRVGSVD